MSPTFARTIGIDYSGAETPTASLKGLRVGVPGNYYFDRLTPEAESRVRHAIQLAGQAGAELIPVALVVESSTFTPN